MNAILDRYKKLSFRLRSLNEVLYNIREALEYVEAESANELFAFAEEALKEYEYAMNEYCAVCHSINYINVIDFFMLCADRDEMIAILECILDDDYTREDLIILTKEILNKGDCCTKFRNTNKNKCRSER